MNMSSIHAAKSLASRIFKPRILILGLAWGLLASPLLLGIFVHAGVPATTNQNSETAYDLQPVINSSTVPPLVLLVMSRDEQLYNKAYSDYTDLHQGETGDAGTIDSTYDDTFAYSGYFGAGLCYAYDGSVFKADNVASGTNSHSCSSEWSGNFLNWLTMTRLDIVRSVLYGGKRSTDTASQTVLERAAVPNDLHAWVKVYTGSDVASFTPFAYDSVNPVSFCNASIYNANGVPSTGPLMRVVRGNYSEWSATQDSQCNWRDDDNHADNAPKSAGLGSVEYAVRVDVCDEASGSVLDAANKKGAVGEHCKAYTNTSTSPSATDYKPVGLLQEYGESGKIRFGLMTGSYADPRSGGRLRRNIGKFAGNSSDITQCVSGDEVKLSDGTFCNQTDGTEGIVNTINRLELVGWQSDITGGSSGWKGDAAGDNCYAWGGRARGGNGGTWVMDNPGSGDRHCSAYGNPLSEIYAEAVRYIQGQGSTATTAFDTGSDANYITGIPDHVTWKDPYRDPTSATDPGNPYCASCSILVLSTGLNSFDSDEIPDDTTGIVSKAQVIAATDLVGDDEGITGNNYLIGRVLGQKTDNGTISPTSLGMGVNIDTNADLCTKKEIDHLSNAIGVCLDVPSLEGSYDIAGLAFKAWTTDLRPDLKAATGQEKPADYVNKVQTYTVALAETLPSFAIKTGTGTINFSPLCQSNTDGGAVPSGRNWSSCALGSVEVGTKTSTVSPNYIYGRDLASDNSTGSFAFLWEDSTFGSDHDLDASDMISWCVGATCSQNNGQAKKNLDGTTFAGNDICWRSDHTSTDLDYSAACGSDDKPSVGDDEVLVRIETMSTAGSYAMLTGYNISGTTSDGVNRIALAPGSFNSILTGQADPPGGWYHPIVLKFKLGSSHVGPLQNPLYYAAKYGGFQDSNANGKPDLHNEWDAINNATGSPGADGIPDNFFPVHNPSLLASQLGAALNAIIKRTGSGTAAAVVSNSVNGDGTVYRALYQPETQDSKLDKVFWTGTLNSLWTDSAGLLREDGNGNAVLDDYATDPIVVFSTDASTSVAVFSECKTTNPAFNAAKFDPQDIADTCPGNTGRLNQPLQNLEPIWDAQQQLWSAKGAFATGIETQRTYASTADTGRYILTWIDKNHNGVVDSGEETDFVWKGANATGSDGFYGLVGGTGNPSGDFGFLNTNDPTEAQCIVNWVRGEESDSTNKCGMRSRTIDGTAFGGTTGNVVARLGDIIDSTPLVIGRPAEAYDQLYGDTSYADFKSHYRNRRQVVYVGANDGMLHAFNAGFYDSSQHALYTQPHDKSCDTGTCSPDTSITAHPLGSEIWAYIPGNLLPHLRWLTDPQYQAEHVFYVDGNPVATDAKVFADDGNCSAVANGNQCHPGGWGTVLVVPFRLGGGLITVPTAKADDGTAYDPATCDPDNCVAQAAYSSYLVLDVTDPEQPPTVLAELHPGSDDGHGQSFTSSVPAFAVMRNPSAGTPNNFFMFIGSGPTGANGINPGGVSPAVTSTAPLRVFAYDLGCITGLKKAPDGCGATDTTPLTVTGSKTEFDLSNVGGTSKGTASFAGDLIASDFNLNGRAESVYFGSVRDPGTTAPVDFGGSLWKIRLGENTDPTTWTPELVYDVDKPIAARPTIGLNNRGAPEVYAGTGRVFSKDDLATTGKQQILGMIDPELLPSGDAQGDFALPLVAANLEDVTKVTVCADITNALCTYEAVTGDPSGKTTFADFYFLFDKSKADGGKAGFSYDLSAPGTSPAERVVSAQALLGGVLITNTFIPGVSICNNVGTATEFAMNYKTGSADPNLAQAKAGSGFGFGFNKTTGVANISTSLGAGLPAAPSLHVGTGTGTHGITACTQTSTGAVICQKIATLGTVLSAELSWREPLDQ